MTRYLLTLEYDGAAFFGWQKQPDVCTVQGELERVIGTILQHPVEVQGQGRTDKGVHALGQTAHVDVPIDVDGLSKFIYSVNQLLPDSIHVRACVPVHPEFHARFDALSRFYEYRIRIGTSVHHRLTECQVPSATLLRLSLLEQCAALLPGEHDFSFFSKPDPELSHAKCTIYSAEWVQDESVYFFRIEGNRFLRNMVRRLVGTMMVVGTGEMDINQFEQALTSPSKSVTEVSCKTAPAHGLTLLRVKYPFE